MILYNKDTLTFALGLFRKDTFSSNWLVRSIINDHFNRENGNSRVQGPGTLRTGNNRGRRKSTHRRGRGSSLPGSSLEETKERSRFNASNVGRDKLSKHFSRYYQALCADLPHVLRRVFAEALSNPLPLSSLLVSSSSSPSGFSSCSSL